MRSVEWQRAVKRYVLPMLPGSWVVRGALLYQLPVDWTARYVLTSSVWSLASPIGSVG